MPKIRRYLAELPVGWKQGSMIVVSEKCRYYEDTTYNRWGYFCRCALCDSIRWYPESSVKYRDKKSCGCLAYSQDHTRIVSPEEIEFVRKHTR